MTPPQPCFTLDRSQAGQLTVRLDGAWTLHAAPPSPADLLAALASPVRSLAFAADALDDWNHQYYGKPVQVFDILINQKWNNRQADPLRNLLPKPGRNAQPIGR